MDTMSLEHHEILRVADVTYELDLYFYSPGTAVVRKLRCGSDAQRISPRGGRVDGYFQSVAGATDQRGREVGMAG